MHHFSLLEPSFKKPHSRFAFELSECHVWMKRGLATCCKRQIKEKLRLLNLNLKRKKEGKSVGCFDSRFGIL